MSMAGRMLMVLAVLAGVCSAANWTGTYTFRFTNTRGTKQDLVDIA